MSQTNQFYIDLPSDSSIEYYPENTLSRYTTRLAHTVELKHEDNWHVGIVELSYPYGFDTLESSVVGEDNEMTSNVLLTRVGRIVFPARTYNELTDLYSTIRDAVSNTEGKRDKILNELQYSMYKERTSLEFMKGSRATHPWIHNTQPVTTKNKNILSVTYRGVNNSVLKESIEFPVRLYYGIDDLVSEIRSRLPTVDHALQANTMMKNLYMSDVQGIHLAVNKRTVDDIAETQPVFIYTDIIKPVLVGDTFVRRLRVIQFPNSTGHHIFQPTYYMPVEKTRIESISIALHSKNGNPVRFETSPIPTYAVLHFIKGNP
jgi:hypothetical protein